MKKLLTRTLVLIPGLLCDDTVFAPLIQQLDVRQTVYVPDLASRDSITDMALDTLAGTSGALSVIGFSMGGRVALEMMRLESSRIARLVLLDTGVHPVRPGEAEQRYKLVILAREHGMTALAEQWLPMMVGTAAVQNPKLMESLQAMVLRHTPEIHQRQINALLSRPDAAPVLKNIRCPTLIGVGRNDPWSPVAQHEAMHRAIPHSNLAIFEQAGHFALLERPEQVNEAVLSHLRLQSG